MKQIEYSILRSSSDKPRELATFFSASTAFSSKFGLNLIFNTLTPFWFREKKSSLFSCCEIAFLTNLCISIRWIQLTSLDSLFFTEENDPRKIYALNQAVPFVSFVLCTTSTNSPRIQALYAPESLHLELRARASAYISQNVTYSTEDCKIYLPSIFNDFSRDFCSAKSDIVNVVIGLSANKMREELKLITNSKKMKLSFNSVIWNPSFIIWHFTRCSFYISVLPYCSL